MNLLPLPDGNVRNLPSRPAIAKKLFSTWASPLFYIILLYRQEMVLKIVLWTNFTLFETSLVLKKEKCSYVENTLVLKFHKAILKK